MTNTKVTSFSVLSPTALAIVDSLAELQDSIDCDNPAVVRELLDQLGSAQVLVAQLINRGRSLLNSVS